MTRKFSLAGRLAALFLMALLISPICPAATIDDAADLPTQQAQEKQELQEMKNEMNDIKGIINDAQHGMDNLRSTLSHTRAAQEMHLIVKDAQVEVAPGVTSVQVTYNGQVPGPVLRCREGDALKVVLHNQTKFPTSLCFHGMTLPQAVSGLPHKDGGLVAAGESYAFQFVAPRTGTYWYHPQANHFDQMAHGLYGAIVVDPAESPKTYDQDYVIVLGLTQTNGKNYYTMNGKSAPGISPIELATGQKIRFRVINASPVTCPLYLTGHKFDVVAINGSDALEPHFVRDTIALCSGDRVDLEFTANNPGVWSLTSMIPGQASTDGKFPGGMAMIVRYPEMLRP